MLKITQCKVSLNEDHDDGRKKAISRILRCQIDEIEEIRILRKSIDSRKKPQIFAVYSMAVKMKHQSKYLERGKSTGKVSLFEAPISYRDTIGTMADNDKIAIVGSGPAGLFAAYYLALAGANPIVLERGASMEERVSVVSNFWAGEALHKNTNVSFGEGGAGTFSDGKLNTGVKDRFGRIRFVLESFVEQGAPEEILYDAKPHVGTDRLQQVVIGLRKKIEELGGTFLFHTQVVDYVEKNQKLTGLLVEDKDGNPKEISCDHCILAIGHSARDTFHSFFHHGMHMEPKPFAVGVRMEHPQKYIDEIQYGKKAMEEYGSYLPPADYKCTGKTKDGRGVYSFCMCPGGFVVNASSEEGYTVVNGMSNCDRAEKNANSAVVVSVSVEDFGDSSVLGGIEFQRKLEKAAWEMGKGKIPVQLWKDFREKRESVEFGRVTPNTKGGTMLGNARKLLPENIGNGICDGIEQFARRMKGFDYEDAIMLGVETRTSSPVRLLRDENYQSNIQGIYPCGEGAGYAGGIMSAAADGLKIAEYIVHRGDSL